MRNRLTRQAKVLRRDMTDVEKLLWSKIRAKQLGVKFRRQQPISSYVVDFVCFDKKLIIELDGGQHFENDKDVQRDNFLKARGYKVLRFWNNEVMRNIESVVEVIRQKVTLPLIPSRQGRGNSGSTSRQGRGNSRCGSFGQCILFLTWE